MQRIIASCKELGSPLPEWRIEPEGGLWVEFPFSVPYQTADARAAGKTGQEAPETTQEVAQEALETVQEVAAATQETAQETRRTIQEVAPTAQEIPGTAQETAPTTQERILALLKAEPRITRRLMAERIGITPSGVKYHLTKLRKARVIRHVGPTKAGRWEVLK